MSQLLIISQIWPEPDSSAAGSRMMQLIELFREHNFDITYASTASKSDFAADLKGLGVKTTSILLNHPSFSVFLEEEKPDIVLFDRFMVEEQFGWQVAETCPDALRILDTEDLHFLRKARRQAFNENRSLSKADLFSETAKREIASILRCDLSLIISEAEEKLLIEQFKIDKKLLCYLPFLLEEIASTTLEMLPSFEERNHFISIGNFLHPPNWDKTRYLKEEVWPLVRAELPAAELHIYGAYASQKVEQLHAPKEGFFIEGRAAVAKTVFEQAKVVLAPLRFGAGLKGKFIEAMQCGTPCVTTTIGAEGIGGGMPWNGEIANTPTEIARAAVVLYQNKKRWKKAQESGLRIINQRFQKAAFSEKFFAKLFAVQTDLEKHRRENFFGSLLMHHTAQSTKYMAKWIEAKNRNNA